MKQKILILLAMEISAVFAVILAFRMVQSRTGEAKTDHLPGVSVTPTPKLLEKVYRERPVFSDDGNFFAYIKIKEINKDNNQLKLVVFSQGGGWETFGGGGEIYLGETSSRFYNSPIVWSSDTSKLAVGVGKDIWMVKFRKEETVKEKSTHRQLVKDDFFKLDSTVSTRFIWFNEQKLYAVVKDTIQEIWPENKIIRNISKNTSELVKAGEGVITYLESVEEGFGVHDLVIMKNNREARYRVPSEGMDWTGDIKLSPGLDKACVRLSASGYSGYMVFRLGAKDKLIQGQQYSKCLEWIDNNIVMLEETSYYSQWQTQTFAYNTSTGVRKLVSNTVEDQRRQGAFPVYW